MPLVNLSRKQALTMGVAVVVVAFAEFFVLEGTLGISSPSSRNSALSTVEIRSQALDTHYVTHNRRFTVVKDAPGETINTEPLVLRELFFLDLQPDREGPPDALITVEAIMGESVRWRFQASGERGDAVTSNLYRVVNYGNGETPNTYTYFSLADGRKLLTNEGGELSNSELEHLDGSVARQGKKREQN